MSLRAIMLCAIVGCAHVPSIVATSTSTYDCTDTAIVSHGNRIEVLHRGQAVSPTVLAHVDSRDQDGAHFTTRSSGDAFAIEYVVPDDPHEDLVARVVDVHNADSLVRRDVCMARGGYTDALAHYMKGESFEQIAGDLSLADRDTARGFVHAAMLAVQRRYHHDR